MATRIRIRLKKINTGSGSLFPVRSIQASMPVVLEGSAGGVSCLELVIIGFLL